MNKRIDCIISHIPAGRGLIDVGTDHGYLPVALAQRGYPGRLIASDIHAGPLHAAVRSAEEAGLVSRIEFRLADGLDACDPEAVDTIVIAGMGGDTICRILDRAEWCMNRRYTLVLQPMTRAEVLRYWLIYNEFEIVSEDLVEDTGILYSVLTARFGGCTRLNEAELYTGAFSALREQTLFLPLLELQIQRFEKRLAGLQTSSENDTAGKISIATRIVSQLKEMRDRAASE